jgi:hypothetical protein
MTSSIN